MASSDSDSNSGSRTSHQTPDEVSDKGDVGTSNACSDDESGSEVMLDHQTTDVTKEHMTSDIPEKRRTPHAFKMPDDETPPSKLVEADTSNLDHARCPDPEQTQQETSAASEVLTNGMSTYFTATESWLIAL